jgi:hypothetical protein
MNTKQWANKVERAATDPERIEQRKGIAPGFTVPRHRLDPEPTITYLSADALAEMEASEQKVPDSHGH